MMKQCCAVLAICALPALAAPTNISDPLAFVKEVYRHFVEDKSTPNSYVPPQDIFTPRLKALIDNDRRQAKGEVGCLDFDFWVNGQDWSIKSVAVTQGPAIEDRQTIIAKFTNAGSREEMHLDFRKIGGRWMLDEVHRVTAPGWTLSEVLKCRH